eukprot:3210928-Amphidinium_carterae.1
MRVGLKPGCSPSRCQEQVVPPGFMDPSGKNILLSPPTGLSCSRRLPATIILVGARLGGYRHGFDTDNPANYL